MKIRNMLRTAKAVRENERFDQGRWVHPCGAPACIAGTAAALTLAEGETMREGDVWHEGFILNAAGQQVDEVKSRAVSFLGLSGYSAEALFDSGGLGWPLPWEEKFQAAPKYPARVRAEIAAQFLEALARGEAKL